MATSCRATDAGRQRYHRRVEVDMKDHHDMRKRLRRAPVQGSKPVIGLAGGIGCGKSLVASQLASLGCGVINADDLAHEVLQRHDVRDQLVAWWGPDVLGEDGQVARRRIAKHVFGAPGELKKLESLVHPFVHELRQAAREKYQQQADIVAIVEDCPLLFEVKLEAQCDVVIFVTARRDVQLARVKANRGWAEADLLAREKNQLPLDMKQNLSDHVIDNSGDTTATFEQVRHVLAVVLHHHKSSTA